MDVSLFLHSLLKCILFFEIPLFVNLILVDVCRHIVVSWGNRTLSTSIAPNGRNNLIHFWVDAPCNLRKLVENKGCPAYVTVLHQSSLLSTLRVSHDACGSEVVTANFIVDPWSWLDNRWQRSVHMDTIVIGIVE